MPRATVFDQWAGIKTGWHKDPATGKNTIVNTQDCSDILRLNAHSRNHEPAHNILGDRLMASIPVVLYYDTLAQDGIDARTWMQLPRSEKRKWERKKLNGEWSRLRAVNGRL